MIFAAAPWGTFRTLFILAAAAMALLASEMQAQQATPTTAVTPAAAQAQAAPPTTAVVSTAAAAAEPKYAAKDMARAFGFMDANKDGQISREEASGFRGVARHFDEADLNKDSALSSEEFESALNGKKGR